MTISANRGIVVNNGEVTLDNVNLEITTNKEHYNNPIEAIKKVILINTVCDKYEDHYAKYHRAEQYQIWIAKQQINEINCKDVKEDGTVVYDASTKTLTLNNVTIQGSGPATGYLRERGLGIYTEEPGLTINVKGTCTVSGDTDNQAIYFYGKCDPLITGDGTLKLNSNIEALYDSGTLDTLTIGGEVTVEADGGIAGMYRFRANNQIWYNSLRIKDNATVKAYRDSSSGLYHWDNLILEDDHAITTPQGAYWDANKHLPVNADGSDITGGWVTIEKAKTYDQVYVASITADTITIDMKTATPEQIQLFIGINALSIVEELQIEDKSKTEANFLNKNGKLLLQGLTIDETTAQFILADGVTAADSIRHDLTEEERERLQQAIGKTYDFSRVKTIVLYFDIKKEILSLTLGRETIFDREAPEDVLQYLTIASAFMSKELLRKESTEERMTFTNKEGKTLILMQMINEGKQISVVVADGVTAADSVCFDLPDEVRESLQEEWSDIFDFSQIKRICIYFDVEDFNPYDLNGDGSVDVSDVTLLVAAVLDEGAAPAGYDLNKDTGVDIGDVTELVSAVLAQ